MKACRRPNHLNSRCGALTGRYTDYFAEALALHVNTHGTMNMNPNRRRIMTAMPLSAGSLMLSSAGAHAVPASHPAWANGAILLRSRFVELSVVNYDSGTPFPVFPNGPELNVVGGDAGQAYRLKVRNLTGGRLLVVASVDGLNVLSGKEASPHQGGYIVPAYGEVIIDGWRKSLNEIAKFVFSSPASSYAAKTGRAANIGVIGLAVFEERVTTPVSRATPFSAESALRGALPGSLGGAQLKAAAPMTLSAPSLGTGHGERDTSRVTQVEFTRATSDPAEVVRLYYESLAVLEAKGIALRQPVTPRANPFPASQFVPDPPRR